jgi:hypothetical protein
VTTPILDTLHFSVNGPSRHAVNCAESPVNDLGAVPVLTVVVVPPGLVPGGVPR